MIERDDFDLTYLEFPSNEQRLDYLDNPHRSFTPVRDFNYKIAYLKDKDHEEQTAVGLLHSAGEEDEVSE